MPKKQLNYIAQHIMECFKESGQSEAYLYEKHEILSAHTSKYETLEWAIYLDNNHMARLAERLKLPAVNLKNAIQVLCNC